MSPFRGLTESTSRGDGYDRSWASTSALTLTGASINTGANNAKIGVGGAVGLTKSGFGTLALTGVNTYSGTTAINEGTVTAAASSGSALGSTTAITVNSGGRLLLGASNQIKDTAPMTLAGGTFARGDF